MYKNARALVAFLTVAAVGGTALADHVYHTRPDHCEPGYTLVEEIHYKDVVCKVCKPVTETKKHKKWVYSTRAEEFCLPKLPPLLGGHGCCRPGCDGACPQCKRCSEPQCRTLLVKRQVEECDEPTTQCVIETVVKRVPYVVYRKVPCAAPRSVVPGHAALPHPATQPAGKQ